MPILIQYEKSTGKWFHVDPDLPEANRRIELTELPSQASDEAIENAIRARGRRITTKE